MTYANGTQPWRPWTGAGIVRWVQGANQRILAKRLSELLTAGGRADITVIGPDGYTNSIAVSRMKFSADLNAQRTAELGITHSKEENKLVLVNACIIANMVLCKQVEQSPGEVWRSFYGASTPGNYLGRLLDSIDRWDKDSERLFLVRCIEASSWIKLHNCNNILAEDETVDKLAVKFPVLKDRTIRGMPTVSQVGRALAVAYPDAALKRSLGFSPPVRFHRLPSPSSFFEEGFAYPVKPFSAKELNKVMQLLTQGAEWERKYPYVDFGMDVDSTFLKRLRFHFPKLSLQRTVRGVSVRAIATAVRDAK